MRKQYHSRPTSKGNFIWDVQRLIELTASLPIEQVALTAIFEMHETFWFEAKLPLTYRAVTEHAKLIVAIGFEHPTILSADGRVMDRYLCRRAPL